MTVNSVKEKLRLAKPNAKNERHPRSLPYCAHRLSTIIDSDRIFVIEEGALIDSGTHRELLRRCSLYKNLYDKGSGKTAS